MEGTLTHLDSEGNARMVDVSEKAETSRWARARAVVRMSPETAARVQAGDAPKGDVLTVARLAAIQAAKRTDELIPLAHSLPLSGVETDITVDVEAGTVTLICEARVAARTGVEMEAMVACSIGALAIYDMVKGIEKGVVVERVELLDKTGGKSGLPPMRAPLIDGHSRSIGDVRISVTDRCNFRCQYCMPAEGLPWLDRDELLSYEEIARARRR